MHKDVGQRKKCCPMCHGKGLIPDLSTYYFEKYSLAQRKEAFELRQKGYSLRDIAEKMNLKKGAQCIKHLIDSYIKNYH